MARFCPLYSGSSGNCTFVGNNAGGILVDTGVSCKKIVDGLKSIGESPENISGIFITHEHSDHIQGLNIFLKKYNTSVYATEDVLDFLIKRNKVPAGANMKVLTNNMEIGSLNINYFSTPHDSVGSVGYTVETESGIKMGVATDFGYVTEEIKENLLGLDLVLLESNYDERMLETGSYPNVLKTRVRGKYGHLSNVSTAKFALDLVKSGTTRIILGHLSENNNRREIAYNTTLNALLENKLYEKKDYLLEIAKRHEASKVMYI